MNIKSYIKQNKLTMREIATMSGVPYSTVNDLINGRVDIDHVRVRIAMDVAKACNVSFDSFYAMCKEKTKKENIDENRIVIKNKEYFLEYKVKNASGHIRLCKVKRENEKWVEEMARMELERIKKEQEIEEVESWKPTSISS